MGFYSGGKRGTVTHQRFNVRGACKRLYEGMKGIGTNEYEVTEVIAGHTLSQRQQIKTKYKIMYGKDLIKELDSELSGAFLKVVLALLTEPEEYILENIRNAIVKSRGGKLLKKIKKVASKKGLCSDAYTLLGILCLRTNDQLDSMKKAYKAKYETELEEDFGDKDFPDEFRSLIFGIILAQRDESPEVDLDQLQEDIDNLQNGTGGSTKEEYFQTFFEERSWKHLRQLYNSYKDVTGQPIQKFVESSEVFSDIMKESYVAVIKIVISEADFYAERLREAIAGLGTDDDVLVGIITMRSEIDLVDIIERYEVLFGISLEDDVAGDTSGDYKNILMKLLSVPEYDEDDHTHHHARPHHVKKQPGVEMSTQTDVTEDDKVVVGETEVNKADHDGEEAIGHDIGKMNRKQKVEVAEEKTEEKEEVVPPETEAVAEEAVEEPQAEETEIQEENVPAPEEEPKAAEEIEQVGVEEEKEEETITEGENVPQEEQEDEVERAEDDDKTIMEDEEENLETATTTTAVSISEEGETDEKKKAEEVDNADGG